MREKKASWYLKLKVIGAVEMTEGKTLRSRLEKVADTVFLDEDGIRRQFTWRTIQTWHRFYKKYGVTRLDYKTRSDKGKSRKITPEELLEAINQVLPNFKNKRYNRSDIYRICIEKGLFQSHVLSLSTFYKFIRQYDLLKNDVEHNKKRLAFAMQHANELWQADTMFGPYVKDKQGKSVQTKLIAFLDDASRLICHAEFFLNENTQNLMQALKKAFYKRGIPQQLYVDNGSIYSSREITLVCARVGCILRHAPVRDGAAKGKVERFFRTVRDQFLNRVMDLSSLHVLNKQFTRWVEDSYNNGQHSALGMKPIDRFGLDLKRIRFLSPNQANDELFYVQVDRKVKKDNTFSLNAIRYEAPADLRERAIQVRFDRNNLDTPVIVYFKDHHMGTAKKLDLIANGQLGRRSRNDY